MSDELHEIWLPIPAYEGLYSVSSCGRVRSESRIIFNKGSNRAYAVKGKMLKPSLFDGAYQRVSLSKNGKVKYTSIHSLVLLAFVGARPKGADICHADGNPSNNRLDNLRYDTRAANIVDSQTHGTFSEAETHPYAILSNQQALNIYNAVGESAGELAKKYRVSRAVIQGIWRGSSWKSVTGGKSVIKERGAATYLRTKLSKKQAEVALFNRANRTHRKDGKGISPTAIALGVDADVIKTFYAAIDAGKRIIFAE